VAEFGRQKVAVASAADAMVRGYLECVSNVIYCSTYVGLSDVGKNLGGSIFL